MAMKRCAACGNSSRKTVRATVIRSDSTPRVGLVCRHCAACGTLVVPGTLRMLQAKPKRVAREKVLPKLLANVAIAPRGES